ncbi:MAG: transposase [Bacteroidales bacterium]|nr:transposase [Bacteroidales bacterium]
MERQYREHLSGFEDWDHIHHAEEYLIFPQNVGEFLSIDETSLSDGELYTIVTNKAAHGKKGTLVAIIQGTKSDDIVWALNKIPHNKRSRVKEVTLDMAPNMAVMVKKSFPNAIQVVDRFHVQKLAFEAVQEIRIKYRWEAMDQENKEIELAREFKKRYVPEVFNNGDTLRQLLARSRYLLFKQRSKWTYSQKQRAALLFERYPLLEKAYDLSIDLGRIYSKTKDRGVALTKLAQWYDKVEKASIKSFAVTAKSIQENYSSILQFFTNRSTNASAESFNAKIKAFRTQFRGVNNIPYFLFRLSKIYA